jgi:glutamate-ammonia-ligase adenylyltransferase
VLTGDFALRERLTEHLEDIIRACAILAGYDAAILGLGSFALQDISPESDADLCLVSVEGGAAIESRAEEFSRILRELRKFNAPVHADFRLRPDGGKGPLVRSIEGLYQYSRTDMEVWERFALGQARSIFGGSEAVSAARDICYVAPLTAQEVVELTKMKQRIENERVSTMDRQRNLKLGHGGLSDIEWLVHVQELKEPRLRPSAADLRISTRIDTLARNGLLNVLEAEVLRDAHTFLQELRTWVQLQGNSDDLLPENPSKLKGLAELMMLGGGEDLLYRHQKTTSEVRALFLQTMERLSQ